MSDPNRSLIIALYDNCNLGAVKIVPSYFPTRYILQNFLIIYYPSFPTQFLWINRISRVKLLRCFQVNYHRAQIKGTCVHFVSLVTMMWTDCCRISFNPSTYAFKAGGWNLGQTVIFPKQQSDRCLFENVCYVLREHFNGGFCTSRE